MSLRLLLAYINNVNAERSFIVDYNYNRYSHSCRMQQKSPCNNMTNSNTGNMSCSTAGNTQCNNAADAPCGTAVNMSGNTTCSNATNSSTMGGSAAYNNMPVGMCYVPWQMWGSVYEPCKALERGTMFPDLDKPFLGGCR